MKFGLAYDLILFKLLGIAVCDFLIKHGKVLEKSWIMIANTDYMERVSFLYPNLPRTKEILGIVNSE